MAKVLCVTVGIIMDIPDDDSCVCAPLVNSPLDELAARLRGETEPNHKNNRPDFRMPGVTALMAAAYHEFPDRN
jgi:hypothetical protein